MIIKKEDYENLLTLIKSQNDTIAKQNRMLLQIKEEVRQANKLIGFYEACMNKGVKIDFPDVTGKGGKMVQNGSKGFNEDNTLF